MIPIDRQGGRGPTLKVSTLPVLLTRKSPLSRGPRERPSAQQMHMQVEHRLPGAGTNVEDSAVSLLDVALARDLRGRKMAASNHFGVGCLSLFQSGKMFLGNDEHVRGSLRLDVFEREDMFILVNFFRWNLAADHAAEKAIGSSVCHGLLSFYRAASPVKGHRVEQGDGLKRRRAGESARATRAQSRRTRKTAPSGVCVSAASFWARL